MLLMVDKLRNSGFLSRYGDCVSCCNFLKSSLRSRNLTSVKVRRVSQSMSRLSKFVALSVAFPKVCCGFQGWYCCSSHIFPSLVFTVHNVP
jgi:hypothetical protein